MRGNRPAFEVALARRAWHGAARHWILGHVGNRQTGRDRAGKSNCFWFPYAWKVSYIAVASVRYIRVGGINIHAVLDCG